MITSILSFALISGVYLFFKYRSLCERDLWSVHYRQARAERVFTRLPIPRIPPRRWDYQLGIPPWNPALMLACGFDPRSYRPHPGDSDRLP